MIEQILKPDTAEALRECVMFHQPYVREGRAGNLVRVGPADAVYHFGLGRRILLVKGSKSGWAESTTECQAAGFRRFVDWSTKGEGL